MAEQLEQQNQAAIQRLLAMSDAELYDEIGVRLQIHKESPAGAVAFDVPEDTIRGTKSLADFTSIGKSFFDRLNVSAYNVVCKSADGHQVITQIVDKESGVVAAAIATLLIGQLGIAAAIAAAVAALIVNLFFHAAGSTLCEEWGKHVTQPQAPQGSGS